MIHVLLTQSNMTNIILDIYMGWPSKGYDLNIKKKKAQ